MEMSHEAEITQFAEARRAKAIEHSPFGPVRKLGETIMRDRIETESSVGTRFTGSQHVYSEAIQGHGAAERTDISDPRQPFYDM